MIDLPDRFSGEEIEPTIKLDIEFVDQSDVGDIEKRQHRSTKGPAHKPLASSTTGAPKLNFA